jgi:hypothetical protein
MYLGGAFQTLSYETTSSNFLYCEDGSKWFLRNPDTATHQTTRRYIVECNILIDYHLEHFLSHDYFLRHNRNPWAFKQHRIRECAMSE